MFTQGIFYGVFILPPGLLHDSMENMSTNHIADFGLLCTTVALTHSLPGPCCHGRAVRDHTSSAPGSTCISLLVASSTQTPYHHSRPARQSATCCNPQCHRSGWYSGSRDHHLPGHTAGHLDHHILSLTEREEGGGRGEGGRGRGRGRGRGEGGRGKGKGEGEGGGGKGEGEGGGEGGRGRGKGKGEGEGEGEGEGGVY